MTTHLRRISLSARGMAKPWFLALLVGVIALAAVGFYASRGGTGSTTAPSKLPGAADTSQPIVMAKVRAGYLPLNLVGLPFFVARDQGFFAKHGIDIELVRLESSPAIAAAVASGDVDFATTLAFAVAVTTEARDPGLLKVFLVDSATPEQNLSALVTRKDSGITKVEDLRGKTIGSFPGPTALIFFGKVLEKHGLDAKKDVKIVELAGGLQIQALMSGQVDALNTYEPIASRAVVEHNAVTYFKGAVETDVINPWQAGVNAVSRKLISDRPDVARGVIAAMYDAIDFIRAHPEDAKKSLKLAGIPDAVIPALPVIYQTKIGEVDIATLQRHADILQGAKLVDKKVDVKTLFVAPSLLPPGR